MFIYHYSIKYYGIMNIVFQIMGIFDGMHTNTTFDDSGVLGKLKIAPKPFNTKTSLPIPQSKINTARKGDKISYILKAFSFDTYYSTKRWIPTERISKIYMKPDVHKYG